MQYVHNKSTLAVVLVELFLAFDGFQLCTVDLSRAGEGDKAPTLKAQRFLDAHPPPQNACRIHTDGYFSNEKLKPTALHNSYYLSK